MQTEAGDPNERVFYDTMWGLVTNRRLRFGSQTLFLRDITGTSIKVVPENMIPNFLMRAGIIGSWIFAVWGINKNSHEMWFAALFTFGLYVITVRSGKQERGQLYVATSAGQVKLFELSGTYLDQPLIPLMCNADDYQAKSSERFWLELRAIEEAISKAMAARQA